MKTELVLFMVMIISINSYPFLRKLADTEESCKNAGKDYQEGKPAQCKTGNAVFEVSAKSECNVGTWTDNADGVCSGTAATALTKESCKGTPVYTEAVITTPASCKANNQDVPSGAASKEACDEAVKWTPSKCNVNEISVDNCAKTTTTWNPERGTCSIGDSVTFNVADSTACKGITASLNEEKCVVTGYDCSTDTTTFDVTGEEGSKVCSIKSIDSGNCKSPSWTITSDASCTAGSVTIKDISDENSCTKFTLKVIEGSCSISGLDETKCVGKYTDAVVKTPASCKLGSTVLTDKSRLKYKSACETELVWQKGTCTNVMVSNEDDCEASKADYTAAVEAKCVDKASSSNSFLAFKIALVLIACLLF